MDNNYEPHSKNEKPVDNSSLPSFVYYSINSEPLKKYISHVKQQIKEIISEQNSTWSYQFLDEQLEKNLHLSLSRVFRIYRKQNQAFASNLKKQLLIYQPYSMIPLSFKCLRIISGKFIALQVDEGICTQRLNKIVKQVNKTLKRWKFEQYFQDPIFHITLFKIKENLKEKDLQIIQKKLEGIKLQRTCFNCKEICLKIGTKVHKLI